jgi:hypothetical protein
VPPGAMRLREASLGAAVLLAGKAWKLDIMALVSHPERRVIASVDGPEGFGPALATALDTESAATPTVVMIGPRSKAALAAKPAGKGRDVVLELPLAAGDDLAGILAEVSSLKLEGQLGGLFAIAVRDVDSLQVLAWLAAACGATLTISGKTARLADSQCEPGTAPPPAPPAMPGAHRLVDTDIEKLRLAGVAVAGGEPYSVFAADDAPAELARTGDVVGRPRDVCRDEKPAWCSDLDSGELAWRVSGIDPDGVTLDPVLVDPQAARPIEGPGTRRLPISD